MSMITREELAKEMQVCDRTIDLWRKRGLPFLKIGRFVRFEREAVENWLKGHKEVKGE
jgi:excisionase family DNA binding protein